MKTSTTKYMLLILGAALLVMSAATSMPTAYGAPLAALTPTAEPATRTPLPQPTNTAAPATATEQPRPTLTPTDVPAANDTPTPQPHERNQRANPALTKSVRPDEAQIGDTVDFALTVTNHGDKTAQDVVVTDPLPNFLDVLDVSIDKGVAAVDGRTVTVSIGPVAPDEVIAIHIRAQVNGQAQPPGGTNTARLTTSSDSNDTSDDSASASVSISLGLVLIATPSPTAPLEQTAAPEQPPAATAGAAPQHPSRVAGGAGTAPRPRMPRTGAADAPTNNALPLALLGLGAIVLSLLIGRRSKTKPY
ncbi:MAG: DUF11 domain-containing protein [Roseiflexaceae bacterium]